MSDFLKKLMDKKEFSFTLALEAVAAGEDPNTLNSAGDSLLHLLVNRAIDRDPKNLNDLRQLVTVYGADIHIKNKRGKTALHCLLNSTSDNVGLINCMLEVGADPNTCDNQRNSLIDYFVAIGVYNSSFIRILVELYKLDINAPHPLTKKTPLQSWLDKPLHSFDEVMVLVRSGAIPSVTNADGQNILHKLIIGNRTFSDKLYIIKQLVREYNLDINAQDKYGKTPLQYALDKNYSYNDIDDLLDLGAYPETTDSCSGGTILHRQIKEKDTFCNHIIRFITLYPAMLSVKDRNGDTPFEVAMRLLKNNFGFPANIIPVVVNSPIFVEKLKQSFQKPNNNGIHEINGYFMSAHLRKRRYSYELQGIIRNMAMDELKNSLKPLNNEEKLSQLRWARYQPIFKQHRSYSFFATFGRTNSVIEIDQMISDVKKVIDKAARPVAKA